MCHMSYCIRLIYLHKSTQIITEFIKAFLIKLQCIPKIWSVTQNGIAIKGERYAISIKLLLTSNR